MTPSEVQSPDDLPKLWKRVAWWDGFVFGDVIAPSWNMFVWGNIELSSLNRSFAHYAHPSIKSICDELEMTVHEPEPGQVRVFDASSSLGKIRVYDTNNIKTLMLNSQAPLQTLDDVRNDRLRWPLIDNPPREMTRREKNDNRGRS